MGSSRTAAAGSRPAIGAAADLPRRRPSRTDGRRRPCTAGHHEVPDAAAAVPPACTPIPRRPLRSDACAAAASTGGVWPPRAQEPHAAVFAPRTAATGARGARPYTALCRPVRVGRHGPRVVPATRSSAGRPNGPTSVRRHQFPLPGVMRRATAGRRPACRRPLQLPSPRGVRKKNCGRTHKTKRSTAARTSAGGVPGGGGVRGCRGGGGDARGRRFQRAPGGDRCGRGAGCWWWGWRVVGGMCEWGGRGDGEVGGGGGWAIWGGGGVCRCCRMVVVPWPAEAAARCLGGDAFPASVARQRDQGGTAFSTVPEWTAEVRLSLFDRCVGGAAAARSVDAS